MLHVQEFLKTSSLEALTEQFAIRVAHSETDPLVILNYDMIDSAKSDPDF